jgi:anaerobic magnesium-protoporphyrin IX monomethyl ester cyclase
LEISLIYSEKDIWAFGIRSVSAMLKKAGYRTKIIVVTEIIKGIKSTILFNNLREQIKSSELIGIGCFSPGSDNAFQIIEQIRSEGKPIVWGGMHATLNPQECAKAVDLVCIGEGEEFAIELANHVEKKQSWKKILNGAFFKDGECIKNDIRPLIQNLDEIPPFDFSFENEYHSRGAELVKVTQISNPAMPIMFNGTRGCAFSCNYCSNSELKQIYQGKGKYVRKMSPSKYIETIKNIKEKFPKAKYFNLLDEDFFAYSKENIVEFARLFKQEIGMPYEVMGSPRNLIREKLVPLINTGLWRINMGVESGSERTKKEIYNRHMSNEEVIAASKLLGEFKSVMLNCFIIVGNPYEENSDLMQTVELFTKMRAPFFLTIYNLILFPGINLYRKAVADNIICGKADSGYEMNFLGGLNYSDHRWKNKNLYLNGIVYLMMGKTTLLRFGLVPRIAIKFLLNLKVISFNDKHPIIIKCIIEIKKKIWRMRSMLIRIVKKVIKNPTRIISK